MPDALSDAQVIKFMKLAKSRLSTNLFEAGNKNFIRNYYGVIKDENTQYYGMITKIKSSDTDISEIRDGFGAEYSLSGQTQSRFPMYQGEWSNNKRHGFGIVSNNVNNSYVVGYWNKNVLNHRRPIIYVTKKSGKTKIYVGLATNEFRVPDPNNVFYIPERHFTNDVVIFEPATETAYQNSSHDMNRLMSSDEMHEIRRMMRVKETLDYMKLTERDHRNREDGFRDLKERYSLILQDLRNQSKATDGSVNVTNIKLSKYAFSTDDSKDEIESGLKDKLSKIKQSDKDDELFKQSDKDDELFKQSDKDDELFKQSDKDDELFKQSDKDELSRANEKLKKLEKEKRDLTQDLDFAIKNNRSALTKSIRAGLTQNDDELNRTRNEITRLENELSKAKQSDKDDELSKMLQYYNSELSKIKQHYDSELSKANEKLEKLEKKKIELKQDLDDARKNNQSEITKAIQAQQNQNYIELGRAQNEITRLENELIKTRNEITRLQDQLYKQQSDIYELSRLQRELENLKKEKRELKRELDDARKNNPALTKAIQAQQNQNDIELERAQNEITRLQDQLIKTRNEITRLQDQLYKQQSSHEDELSKQKWSHKDELSKQKSSHKDELSKMQYQLSSLQSQLKNLENENRELRQSPNVANTKVQQAMNDSKIREIKGAIVGLIVSSGVIIGLPATYDYLSQVKDDRDKRIDVEKKQERNLEDYVNRVTSSINETSSIEDLVMIDTYIKTMSAVDPNQNIRIFDQDDFEKSRSKLLKLLGNKIDSIHAKNLEELIQNTNSSILNATKEKDLRLLDKLDAQITSVTFKDASGIQKFNQDDLEKAKKELSSSILNAKKDISDPGSILDRLSRAWKAFNQDKSSSTPNYAPSKATNVNKASDASPSKSVATNNQSDLQNNIPSKEQNLKNLTDWAETEIQKSLRDFSGENTINRLQEVKRLTLEINNNGSYDNINFTNWKNFTLTRIDTTIERLQNERSQNKSSVSTNASQSSSTSSINKQEKPISVAEKNINLKNLNSSIDIEIRKNLSDSTHLMSMKDRISTLSNSEGKYDSADFFEWKKAIIQRIDSEIERIKKSSTDKRPDTGSASSNAALVDKSINVTNQNNAAPEYPTVSRTKVSDLVRSADIKNLKWNDSPPNLPFITWRGAAFQRNYESDRSNNISRLEKWARDEIESIKNDLDPIVKVARLMKIREGLKAFRNGNYFDEKDFYDMDYRVSLEISNQITRIDNTFKR
jgi:predicted  nucleic acid-binding Zn-ribbon protein